ncbi:LGFP repeat-containing protein [Rhodococcus chondri]|uniref:Esterase n=1 Tax=Rhodococcus chondri TaxID=3065941 RepID=A0ABU7JWT6_9NOCA|nr:esterase [Rhodococcus sp. CC-R104]MEE2034237.1 esterase [Rhodococcus sp. CC-R104]
MKRISRRPAAMAAAIAAVGLIAAGCGDDSSVEDSVASATSAVESAAESVVSEVQTADETTGAESTTGAEETTGTETTGTEPAEGQTSAVPGPGGEEVELSGQILAKYNEVGGATSPLGAATGDQEEVGDGQVAEFDGGIIAWSPDTDAHIVWGEIRAAWEDAGGAGGDLGFPISDERPIEGGFQSDFQNGSITFVDGQTEVMQN